MFGAAIGAALFRVIVQAARQHGTVMTATIELLKTRRSPNIPDLGGPAPSEADIDSMLTAAARVPDHGKLVPWRFIVLSREKRAAMDETMTACFRKDHPQATPDQIEKERSRFLNSPLIVMVVSRAAPHAKIPEWEQVLSAGAACMNLVVAAHSLGYAANWVTGWVAFDNGPRELLGVAANEKVAGVIHIGTPPGPREDRERPNLVDIVTRL